MHEMWDLTANQGVQRCVHWIRATTSPATTALKDYIKHTWWSTAALSLTRVPRQQPLPKSPDKHGSHERSKLFRTQTPYLPRQLTHVLNVFRKKIFVVRPPIHEIFFTRNISTRKFYYTKICRSTVLSKTHMVVAFWDAILCVPLVITHKP